MTTAPVFFISHGAPSFALEPGNLGASLTALGEALSAVTAVLVVSPHWQTREVCVMTTAVPETIHDFGGFPRALYALQYPALGQPKIAAEAGRLLAKTGFAVAFDDRRGLDHGAWVPLFHMRPAADLPVFQVSMPQSLDTAGAVALGQALAPLRQQGVVILCSGSMTHNLYEIRPSGRSEAVYVGAFRDWVRRAVVGGNLDQLIGYRDGAPHAERAHPTEEHFLPLLVAMGACADGETPQILDGETTYGVISMESYRWG